MQAGRERGTGAGKAWSMGVWQRRGRAGLARQGRKEREEEGGKKRRKENGKKKKKRRGDREEKGERDGEIRAAIAAPVGLAQRRVRARTRPQGSGRGLEIGHLEQREIPENRVRGLGGF